MATKAERRLAIEQGLATTRIEGHEPAPEFLADCEKYVEGSMSTADMLRAAKLRAVGATKLAELEAAARTTKKTGTRGR